MQRSRLTELATNPDLISGIYNYCDRWCERCSFTSRCLLFATEQDTPGGPDECQDIDNEDFWFRLRATLLETQEMIREWAEESGIDLSKIDDAALMRREHRFDDLMDHPLAVAGSNYASDVSDWFASLGHSAASLCDLKDIELECAEQIHQASEVIHWYQFQIPVKTIRALTSREQELDPDELIDDSWLKDSDGSAKVALVGIDRSISAWRMMQLSLPDKAELVIPLLVQLEQLRQATEKEFPSARDFIRPGFDEVFGEVN